MPPSTMTSALSARELRVTIGGKRILDGIGFDVARGSVTALLGLSGSGKTTLLRCLNGLASIDGGTVTIEGKEESDQRKVRERIGFVFQHFHLWPDKTILENLILAPVLVAGIQRETAMQRARIILERVGLDGRGNDYPSVLSGGQQQRVAIARALMMDPKILLLDEITSALDPETAWGILRILRMLASEGTSIIIVTHDVHVARAVADNVLFMDQGKIVERGSLAEVLDHPKEQRTQKFLSKL